MKFLLILALVLVGIWLWRSNRRERPRLRRPQDGRAQDPIQMISCAHCAVHIPSAQAVKGERGIYCCADHLKSAEG